MRKIIKDQKVIEDQWVELSDEQCAETLPKGKLIVPVSAWQAHKEQLIAHAEPIGILLAPDEQPADIAEDLEHFALVAISFPKFADGRGYSSARELRTRFSYDKEIRAVGDVLRDQIYLMARCGFNAFAVREDRCINDALNAFNDFSVNYQADAVEQKPLYQYR
ncbi:MAG: oxidoreductase [Gammaproteobacteria bacterium]|nr:MAG: oxidoreductase [Gammaproteobacteria bacterium]PCJ17774.1 MAG: oxidoreductase [Gammaproteobacteria bacterium]